MLCGSQIHQHEAPVMGNCIPEQRPTPLHSYSCSSSPPGSSAMKHNHCWAHVDPNLASFPWNSQILKFYCLNINIQTQTATEAILGYRKNFVLAFIRDIFPLKEISKRVSITFLTHTEIHFDFFDRWWRNGIFKNKDRMSSKNVHIGGVLILH